jgi:hypothetical protein
MKAAYRERRAWRIHQAKQAAVDDAWSLVR